MCRNHEICCTQLGAAFLQISTNLGIMFGRVLNPPRMRKMQASVSNMNNCSVKTLGPEWACVPYLP